MTVDTAALRRTHVDGWRPRQSVSIDVETLRALLDELEVLRERGSLVGAYAAVEDDLRGLGIELVRFWGNSVELTNEVETHGMGDAPTLYTAAEAARFELACGEPDPEPQDIEP